MKSVIASKQAEGVRQPGWLVFLWFGCVLMTLGGFSAHGYVLQGQRWPSNQPIVMDLRLGTPGITLLDGSTSWDQVAKAALDLWNPSLGSGVQFAVSNTGKTPAQGDGTNSVFFSNTIYGESFGEDTLAITISLYNPRTNVKDEADVIFNAAQSFNSYRGPLRYTAPNNGVFDLRRVALHEFGHVLGLNHVAQTAASIMAPATTNIETLQPDDIAGAQAIYGMVSAPVITSTLSAGGQPGKAFTYQITATGAPTSYQASGLPAGLSLNTTTGLISGVTTDIGAYHVIISATNAVGTTTATLTLTVDVPPVITGSLEISAQLGKPFAYQITADNQPTSFSVSTLPGGLSLDPASGLISGTPTVIGSFSLTLDATNGSGTGSAVLALKIVLLDSALTVLHSFGGPDGSNPMTPLIQGGDGAFYGTTNRGGVNGGGTAFKITADGVLTTLYSFGVNSFGSGSSALVQAGDGNFYGITANGGESGYGAFFQLTSVGVLTILHSFTETEGNNPFSLILGADGDFYGTANRGGPTYAGTIFRVTRAGVLTTLYSFERTGASYPAGALVQGDDGNFFGLTSDNGLNAGNGSVFKMTPDGTLTILHRFTGADGRLPGTSLVRGKNGNFYGTTSAGGDNGYGTFFKLTADGNLTVLHHFVATDGLGRSALIQASDGNFYGTTFYSAPGVNSFPTGGGNLFKLTPSGTLTMLHVFDGTDGGNPGAALLQGVDGSLYGTTSGFTTGSTTDGTIFRRSIGLTSNDGSLPVVTLAATTPEVTLGSDGIGVFTVSLAAPLGMDLFVNYTIKGSAANGSDYVLIKATKKIKAGQTSKPIKILPQGDLGGRAKKTVKLTLLPGDGYTADTMTPAKVKILAGP